MLGQAVMKTLVSDHTVLGVDLEDADLSQAKQVTGLLARSSPEWVIHCAAWTDVDGAESQVDQAMAANAEATAHLAAACDECGAGLTYLSTDYVFNGQGGFEGYAEDDLRDPINAYGLSKARAEEAVERMTGPWQIVRTSWLFGDGRVNFPKTMWRLLRQGRDLKVVDDQYGCPTHADDLAEILAYLVSSAGRGIFHGTNAGHCTWFELAREVARLIEVDEERIQPCPSSEYPTAARRPAFSILASRRLELAGFPERTSWQDAVARYVKLLESGEARHP